MTLTTSVALSAETTARVRELAVRHNMPFEEMLRAIVERAYEGSVVAANDHVEAVLVRGSGPQPVGLFGEKR